MEATTEIQPRAEDGEGRGAVLMAGAVAGVTVAAFVQCHAGRMGDIRLDLRDF